jgi:transposase
MTMRGGARRARRQYALEFKRDAVALSTRQQQEGRSLAAVAKDLGVVPQTLRYWHQTLGDVDGKDGRGAGPRDVRALALEVKRLERELQRAEEERDFLRRAAAFFAKESR